MESPADEQRRTMALRGLHAAAADGDAFARRVAARVENLYPGCPAGVVHAALLLSAVRDRGLALHHVAAGGASARTVETIETLLRGHDEPDDAYYSRVRANPWALMVAHAEVVECADPRRLDTLGEPELERERARLSAAWRGLGIDESNG